MATRSTEYLQSLVRELSKYPDETEWIEFKCNYNEPQMIGEYISALSNSAALSGKPKGYVVWGINNESHNIDGTIFQYRKSKKGNEELESWLAHMLTPSIDFKFFEVSMDGVTVVILEIPCADNQPVGFAGCEYIRIGEERGSGYDKIIAATSKSGMPAPRVVNQNNLFTRAVLIAKVPFDLMAKEDKLRTCYMKACLAYVTHQAISNADVRDLFGLSDSEMAKASRIIKETVGKGLIKPFDPDAAPRYMKYVPFWA